MNITKFLESFTDDKLYTAKGDRRESFTQFGAIGKNLAIASVPFGLTSLFTKATAQDIGPTPNNALGALQLALTLEYLEDEFYRTGLNAPGLIPNGREREVFEQISQHEAAHVAFLQAGITGAAGADAVPAKPDFDFTAGGNFSPFTVYAEFLALAQAFEDTGVRAYKGQAGNLQSDDTLLTYGLQIHSVEARHASEVRRIRNLKGWIPGNDEGGHPAAADSSYAGESNFTQAGFNTQIGTNALSTSYNGGAIPNSAGAEAFDEILTTQQAVDIANVFII